MSGLKLKGDTFRLPSSPVVLLTMEQLTASFSGDNEDTAELGDVLLREGQLAGKVMEYEEAHLSGGGG